MLNKNGERELAYVVKIDNIEPITGSDNCEAAVVGGWKIMTRKGTFKAGDLAIYFEIDSKVPETEVFSFLAGKHYKVKTQKYTFGGKGNFISQGLLMHANDFRWELTDNKLIKREKDTIGEGYFLTKELGVTYADPLDNGRKAKSDPNAKYKAMAGRHPKLFRNPIIKAIYKTAFGKKLLFIFFGKKSDKKRQWPEWVVKTDEERIQNLAHMIPEFAKERWIATEKVDGTSTTFTMRRKGKKFEYYVCSRNVVMNQPGKDKTCYYAETAGNVYTEMSDKYNMENVLRSMFIDEMIAITVQGETYGNAIQKRDYSISGHDLAVFNVIFHYKDGTTVRLNPYEGAEEMAKYGVPYVPIIGEIDLPDSCDKILELAGGKSEIDGLPREGIVFRTTDGKRSFKAVDNNFILKYHN